MIRRTVASVAILLLLAPAASEAGGLLEWICKKLKKSCSAALESASVRGPGQGGPASGIRLVVYEPAADHETVLWECETCWSPAVLSASELAVLRTDGLWVVPLSQGTPTRMVEATGLLRILGVSSEGVRLLIVLQESASGPCPAVAVADLDAKAIHPLADLPRDEPCNVFGPRVDQVRNDLLVDAAASGPDRPLRLRVGPSHGKGPWRLLLPDTVRWDDGASRIDPVWLDDRVVYVVSP